MKEYIIEVVARHCKVSFNDMRSENRKKNFVKARHLYFYFMREYTGDSLADIGSTLFKDHGTVMHGCKSIKNQLSSYSQFRKEIEPIELMIKNAVPVEVSEPDDCYMENDCYTN